VKPQLDWEAAELYLSVVAEIERRGEKERQSRYGSYDDDGVRQDGLIAFVRYFWPVLEPARPMVDPVRSGQL